VLGSASSREVIELVPQVEAFSAIFRFFVYQHKIERKIGQGFSPAKALTA
jgi:hypothetical protein